MALSNTLEMTYFVCYLIAAVMMVVLFFVHLNKLISDLCTKKRSSVQHRRNKPDLTTNYKRMNYLTLACVIYNLCSTILAFAQMTDLNESECKINTIFAYLAWIPAKGTMYMIFMFRLDICYNQSAYGYKRKLTYGLAFFNAGFAAVFALISVYLFAVATPDAFSIDKDSFPNPCWPLFNGVLFINVGLIALWDVIMNVLSLTLFIRPLKKTLDNLKKHHADNAELSKMSDRMIYIAVKYTILACVAVVSTFVTLTLVFLQILAYLQIFDLVINTIAVMLMTTYYPDDIFYEHLCKLCLLCCPKRFRKYQSHASKGLMRKKLDPDTKDTDNAFQENKKEYTVTVHSKPSIPAPSDVSDGRHIDKDLTPAPPVADQSQDDVQDTNQDTNQDAIQD